MSKVSLHINHILDVNGAWREFYSELGCLLAFDADMDWVKDTIHAGVLSEDLGISSESAAKGLLAFAFDNNYVWDEKTIKMNLPFVENLLEGEGFDAEYELRPFRGS